MLRLGIVLSVGNKNGGTSQFMVIEEQCESIEKFLTKISDCDFIIVNEKYRKKGERSFGRVRKCILNTNRIGRVAEYDESED